MVYTDICVLCFRFILFRCQINFVESQNMPFVMLVLS